MNNETEALFEKVKEAFAPFIDECLEIFKDTGPEQTDSLILKVVNESVTDTAERVFGAQEYDLSMEEIAEIESEVISLVNEYVRGVLKAN
jgi:hypothetical protein